MTKYAGISKNNQVYVTSDLNDFDIRSDTNYIFKIEFQKKTPQHEFFNIEYIENGEVIEKPKIQINDINTIYYGGEFWGEFDNKIQGKCIKFKITDLLGFEKKINFSCYPEITSGLENFIKYINDLNRVGTHQAIKEIKKLNKGINYYKEGKEKYKNLYHKLKAK